MFTNISPHLIGSYFIFTHISDLQMYIIYRVVDRLICYWLYLIPIICCGIVPRCVGWDFKWHFINYGDVIFIHVHVISRCLFKFEFSEGFSGYLFKFELSERISGYLFKFELSELIFWIFKFELSEGNSKKCKYLIKKK